MDFLNREGEHANAARSDLILLDLNLPKKDGRSEGNQGEPDAEEHSCSCLDYLCV